MDDGRHVGKMEPISQVATLAQYSAGMGLVYQLLEPSIQRSHELVLDQLFTHNRPSAVASVLWGINYQLSKLRRIAGALAFVSMMFSVALLILLTVNPTKCAFIFDRFCAPGTDGHGGTLAWVTLIFLISGPLSVALTCFAIQSVLNRAILFSLSSK